MSLSKKKIIRLNNQLKHWKNPEGSHSLDNNDQTVMIKNRDYRHVAFTPQKHKLGNGSENEPNIQKRLYKIDNIHQQCNNDKKIFKARISILEKQVEFTREMYEVQRLNHQRLRQYYQKRQNQWISIINQHRKLLDQNQNYKQSFSQMEIFNKTTKFANLSEINYVQDNSSVQQYEYFKKMIPNKGNYQQMSKIKDGESKFTENPDKKYIESQPLPKDAAMDEVFDRMLRKTYCYYKYHGKTVDELLKSDDMIKLKKAKTSTKERLPKTLRKLNFQYTDQEQLNKLCVYIENNVNKRSGQFYGFLTFKYLSDKLTQCEKLAKTSNSEIQKISSCLSINQKGNKLKSNKRQSKNKRNIKQGKIVSVQDYYQLNDVKQQKKVEQKLSKSNSINSMSSNQCQLYLNSNLKHYKNIQNSKFSQQSNEYRESISSLQNLSDVINNAKVLNKPVQFNTADASIKI